MSRRVLLLGTTGVEKADVVSGLFRYLKEESETGPPPVKNVDFEKEFILGPEGLPHYDYLDQRERQQRSLWVKGWERFEQALEGFEEAEQDVFLRLHGVLVRPLYGVRSPVVVQSLIEGFRPTHIVTLIDDVYSMWFRTEKHAGAMSPAGKPTDQGYSYKGRPSLEQLLAARRAELFFGDILAQNCPATSTPRNVLLAVQHPARTLCRLVFGGERVKPVYLSFPISGARRLFADTNEEDCSGFEEVNVFLRQATDFEREHREFAFFCPLTIDEKPLRRCLKPAPGDHVPGPDDPLDFEMRWRWPVQDFYGADEILLSNAATLPPSIRLTRGEVEAAVGCVDADVGTRDYRLVMQSRCLAVFNPFFGGKVGRGVVNEIQCAMFHRVPVRIYQDSNHDPSGEAHATWQPRPGSLGLQPGTEYVTFYDTVDQLFNSLLDL